MPVLDRPAILLAAAGYLLLMLAVGVWAARRTRSPRDFFIAGQRLGLWVTGLATMSAAFSGFVFLGGPGLTYRIGIASLFINLPIGFTAALLCWVLGKRLRLLAETREVYTIPDALAARYGSRATTGLGALAVVAGSVGYLAAQLLALAILVEAIFGTREAFGPASLAVAMLAGLAVVVGYSVAGGMLAGAYTDLLQGILMLGAALLVFVFAGSAAGGWREVLASIAASERFAGFLEPFGRAPATLAFGFFFVFGVGVLGQPHMLHKFYMLRDPRQLKWLPVVLAGSQAVCLLIWVGIGLAVPALVARGRMTPLASADDAAPRFLLEAAPEALAGLVFAGALAAIMSTADSFLNIGSAALVRDLPRLFGRPLADELLWGRVATVGVAAAAALLALAYGDLVALLGTFAFGTFAAALAPALAVGLNWPRVTAGAASASIATGAGLNLLLELAGRQTLVPALARLAPPPGVLPSAVALAASFAVLFAVTWASAGRGERPLDPDVREVMAL